MSAHNKESLILAINRAFPCVPLSSDKIASWKTFLNSDESMFEEAEAFRRYGARPWDQIEDQLVITPFASIHELPHEIFDYYLPRFLIATLAHPYEVVMECLIARFLHTSYDFERFTSAQKKCIHLVLADYLENGCFGNEELIPKIPIAIKKLLDAGPKSVF
jgi:hypothetical protein